MFGTKVIARQIPRSHQISYGNDKRQKWIMSLERTSVAQSTWSGCKTSVGTDYLYLATEYGF